MAEQTCNGKIRLNPGANASFHNDGLVVLHVPSGRIFAANQIGARVWRGLEQELPLEAIAAKISSDYGIDRATAREDTVCFLAELERNGLTERGVQS